LSNFFLAAATLWQRELVRFWRQKSRVLGVVASPLVFWLLIGYGSNDLARFYSGALVLTGVSIHFLELIPVAAAIFLISFTLTGLGFVIAWRMESTSGFHAIMNLLLVPMWMVSGSLFPMSTAHGWVKALMWVNPLTYSIALLNHALRFPNAAPGAVESLVVTAVFGLLLFLASVVMAAQKATHSAA
jgi:ABC-2 type transport system permease protein